MSAWARPGVKCVCVGGDFDKLPPKLRSLASDLPKIGQEYTIRRVRSYPGRGQFLLLHEVRNPHVTYGRWAGEPQFSVNHFRPLVTNIQEQDVSKFRHLLEPERVDA